jgi:hypothetical protein
VQIEHREQVEYKEKIKPPADTSLSNDNEVSTEAHSFIIVLLETQHESKAQSFNFSMSQRAIVYQDSQGFM